MSLSEWEGFGLPAAEAMACGLPVLTHGAQGPAELVPYRDLLAADSAARLEAGSLLLEARPETAAALLARAARDPDLRRRLGEAGRAAMERACCPAAGAGRLGKASYRRYGMIALRLAG